eukprot:329790-Hanusia_phi.AAC.1
MIEGRESRGMNGREEANEESWKGRRRVGESAGMERKGEADADCDVSITNLTVMAQEASGAWWDQVKTRSSSSEEALWAQ